MLPGSISSRKAWTASHIAFVNLSLLVHHVPRKSYMDIVFLISSSHNKPHELHVVPILLHLQPLMLHHHHHHLHHKPIKQIIPHHQTLSIHIILHKRTHNRTPRSVRTARPTLAVKAPLLPQLLQLLLLPPPPRGISPAQPRVPFQPPCLCDDTSIHALAVRTNTILSERTLHFHAVKNV